MAQQFFTDDSIRKWILQIIRLFSDYTVQFGVDSNGTQLYSRVPVIWGDATFSAATIVRLNSENTMPSFPMMSVYIKNLKHSRERIQDPTYIDTKNVRTRVPDPSHPGKYMPTQANAYTVKRLMPVPYDMEFTVDIVTSNTNQKLQLMEQILPLFNPLMEIQKTDNYLDWESLSYVELTDVNWSNRTIPVAQGADSSYDVCSLSFKTPIWLSLPAKVSKMGAIFKVITNISGVDDLGDLLFNTRQIVTFNNYGLYVQNSNIRILNQGVTSVDNPLINTSLYGQPLEWTGILGAYGKVRDGVSQIGLSFDNTSNEILGTVALNPLDSTQLIFNVNPSTLPSNTLPAINAIVNPQLVGPNIGLPAPMTGQSYLLTAPLGYTGTSIATGNANVGIYLAESPHGTVNGINRNFSLTYSQYNANTLVLNYNGLTLSPTIDYNISGSTINLFFAPKTNDKLYSYYLYTTSAPSGFISASPTGPKNGVNKTFALPVAPNPISSMSLFLNGVLLKPIIDYSISGTNLILTFAPSSNTQILYAMYRTSGSTPNPVYSYTDGEVPFGNVNGINKKFTLINAPCSLFLYYNGALLTQGTDYTVIGNTITYNFAPAHNSYNVAYYAYYNISSSNWPYGAANSMAHANINDIITYTGNAWAVTFDSHANIGNVAFVYDNGNSEQYKWNGNSWVNGWTNQSYNNSAWRLII
jgi:hypothetical protein